MDPDANIERQISLCRAIRAQRATCRSSRRMKAELDELRRAYSEWRSRGGFPAGQSRLQMLDAERHALSLS